MALVVVLVKVIDSFLWVLVFEVGVVIVYFGVEFEGLILMIMLVLFVLFVVSSMWSISACWFLLR